jgi:VRR-NUC domain
MKEPQMKTVPIKEKDIQRTILDYLAAKRIFHRKINNVGIFKQSTGSYIPSQSVGMPDIIAVVNGRIIGIEVKRPGGPQSPGQKQFQKELETAGGLYFLVHSVEELQHKLQEK